MFLLKINPLKTLITGHRSISFLLFCQKYLIIHKCEIESQPIHKNPYVMNSVK